MLIYLFTYLFIYLFVFILFYFILLIYLFIYLFLIWIDWFQNATCMWCIVDVRMKLIYRH